MKITDLVEGVSDPLLYHAVSIERAARQLEDDTIHGYTSQRVWKDGVRRKEDDPKYKDHWQLKGISATRDFDFAKKFGGVVYVLDRNVLQQRYKIVPYNWGFHIAGSYVQRDKKREREEFVVFNVLKKSFDELEREWREKYEDNDVDDFINKFDYMFAPKGSLHPLSKYLRGIFINEYLIEIYGEDHEDIHTVMTHPKFKGIIKE